MLDKSWIGSRSQNYCQLYNSICMSYAVTLGVETVNTVRDKWISEVDRVLTYFCKCTVHQDTQYVMNIGPYIAPSMALNGYLWSRLIVRLICFT